MMFEAWFFWTGVAALVVAALALRRFESGRIDDRIARALEASGLQKLERVRVIACGGAEVSVWSSDPTDRSAAYVVTVKHGSARCARCLTGVNEAIEWIEQRGVAA